MSLANLIDLIAEVAAKRTAREGKTKEETPEQAPLGCTATRTVFKHLRKLFFSPP